MRIRTRSLHSAKRGNSDEEYEDAACPSAHLEGDVTTFSCAVADGATETSFSGLWAQLLVGAWCRSELTPRRFVEGLRPLQRTWREEVGRKPLPWYAEEKVRAGAFSSLLGLSLRQTSRTATWRATTVGDSCLFHVQGNRLRIAFPVSRSDQFDNHPHLISTSPAANDGLEHVMHNRSGRFRSGDTFYLLTDALAAWFLQSTEQGGTPWVELNAALDDPVPSRFACWVEDLRLHQGLRNDDVTVLAVDVLWGPPPPAADALANSSGL